MKKLRRSQAQLYIENTENASEILNDLLYEAILTCEKALFAGLQLEEDALRLWTQLLSKSGSPVPIQKDLQELWARIFPKARTRLDQMLEVSSLRIMLLNRASSQCTDLLARAAALWSSSSHPKIWSEMDELAQRFLRTLTADSHIFLNTNTKILQILKDITDPKPFLSAISEESRPRFR